MSPPPGGPARPDEDLDEDGEAQEDGGIPCFADLLGPDCVIKRVDKDKNVIGGAKPEEMQHELMTRASAQKRLGACAEHVKDMSWEKKLEWGVDLKERANEFYSSSSFEEAAKLYNDCLVGLNLDGTEEQNREVRTRLQLPVCTNLAACMIEMGQYMRCVELCNVALSVDAHCPKALYRRGLAMYRLGDHAAARPDFESALSCIAVERKAVAAPSTSSDSIAGGGKLIIKADLDNLEKRVLVYLGHIRRFTVQERSSCKRMFEQQDAGIYADRPGAKAPEQEEPIDDSDEALDAALARNRGGWCCPCRRGVREKTD